MHFSRTAIHIGISFDPVSYKAIFGGGGGALVKLRKIIRPFSLVQGREKVVTTTRVEF